MVMEEPLTIFYREPKYIRTDNGPDFISNQYKTWCLDKNITPIYSEPGKPMQTVT
ncbi:hypothetical protein GCM10009430_32580 [Aquimarina litoralis]|uniref:Integrase catalytic domain-containing protein n=1 Tax=Aquimarina litoralis TaxID=584605 RepID=A0ABP3UCQ9_9FLAO